MLEVGMLTALVDIFKLSLPLRSSWILENAAAKPILFLQELDSKQPKEGALASEEILKLVFLRLACKLSSFLRRNSLFGHEKI